MAKRTLPRNPLENIEYTEGCWYWTGTLDRQGYGQWQDPRTDSSHRAHRVVYELLVGAIPDGLEPDHECHNRDQDCPGGEGCFQRSCVRPHPDHVVLRTHRENVLGGHAPTAINAARTHCVNGHPFDDQNTYNWRGHRKCRACHAERERARRRARSIQRRQSLAR